MTIVSRMMDPTCYQPPDVYDFLGRQLSLGRLALVLGSGVSFGFGLPLWPELIARTANDSGCTIPPGMTDESAAEVVLTKCGNELAFAECVRKALYEDFHFDSSLDKLIHNPLMAALGALAMTSTRGSVTEILSFNFDDLLERYLSYYGFSVESVTTVPQWKSKADVRVYHQHGLLPSDEKHSVPGPIVFAQIDFDRIVGNMANDWRRAATEILASRTCLFIGLSGNDKNLTNMLLETQARHVATKNKHKFWGIRFSNRDDDPNRALWENRGVTQITTSADYKDLPGMILEICQNAATKQRAQDDF